MSTHTGPPNDGDDKKLEKEMKKEKKKKSEAQSPQAQASRPRSDAISYISIYDYFPIRANLERNYNNPIEGESILTTLSSDSIKDCVSPTLEKVRIIFNDYFVVDDAQKKRKCITTTKYPNKSGRSY